MSKAQFEIPLDPRTLEQVDAWRADQPGQPSQSEAVRRLVEAGLAATGKDEVRFSDGEKLIMMMLRDLYKDLNVTGDIDSEFIAEALWGGHYWGLKWQLPGLLHNHADKLRVVYEVLEILEMWYFIESGYATLSEADKTRVEQEFGKNVRFRGFDGNNESEQLGIANFLVNRMERFHIFKGRDFNSHIRSVETYRRMLSVFEPMRKNLGPSDLPAGQIINLLNAQIHPEKR